MININEISILEKQIDSILKKKIIKLGRVEFKTLMISFINGVDYSLLENEFKKYDRNNILMILEKKVLLALENRNLEKGVSYFKFLKVGLPFTKKNVCLLGHYVDNYISDLFNNNLSYSIDSTLKEINDFYNNNIELLNDDYISEEEIKTSINNLLKNQSKEKRKIVNKKGYFKGTIAITMLTTSIIANLFINEKNDNEISKKLYDIEVIEYEDIFKSVENVVSINSDIVYNQSKKIEQDNTKNSIQQIPLYQNSAIDLNLQEFLYEKCIEKGLPFDIAMTILHQESGGYFNTNGVINSTGDYGLAQINECNLDYIYKNLGITKDEILNNPKKNIDAFLFLLKAIYEDNIDSFGNAKLEEIFGTYNGWKDWKNKPMAATYSNDCINIYENFYKNYYNDEKGERNVK